MTPAPRRAPARSGGKSASAIPQVSWRAPQPAPIVLVSGPEEVCAERAIAGVRDYLRAEDASLEVSDLRADVVRVRINSEERDVRRDAAPTRIRGYLVSAEETGTDRVKVRIER